MRKLAVFLIWLLLLCPVKAQMLSVGVGEGGFGSAAAGFQGAGDIVGSAKAYWGFRCYSLAYSGSAFDLVDAATGSTTGSRVQCASGVLTALVSASACTFVTGNACSSIATTCLVSCVVITMYDQSGALACTGSTACNVTQATNANRPVYQASIGTGKCGQFNGTSDVLQTANNISLAQPYTISIVARRTGNNTTTQRFFYNGSGSATFFYNAANQVGLGAGTNNFVTATDASPHSIQGVFTAAGSGVGIVDASVSLGLTLGTNPLSGALILGANNTPAQFLTGYICEEGIWPVAFNSTQYGNMNTNQHSTSGWNF